MNGKQHLQMAIPLHSYLFDHRFEGRAVLPAVEAMQLLAISTRTAFPDLQPGRLRHGAFDKFLYLDELSDPAATSVINELTVDAGKSIRAKLLTRSHLKKAGLTRLKEHVRITFDPSVHIVPMAAIDAMRKLPGSVFSISAEQLYAELVPFGPAYQNIDGELNISEEGALAHLSCPPVAERSRQPLGSPFVLDAAFHAACVWGQRYAATVAFPVGFDERIVFQPTQPGRRFISRVIPLQSVGDPSVLFFDLWVYTEDGEPCEAVRGLRMQDVSGGRWKPPRWVIK